MKTKLVSMLAMLVFANVATAEQDGFKISGDFATSIFNESGDRNNAEFPATGAIGTSRGIGNDDALSVDLAELNIEKTIGNSTIVMSIGYGRIFDHTNYTIDQTGGTGGATAFPGAGPKSTLNLTNAYFAHKLGDSGVSFRLGKFESFMGHETYNYMDNLNYTRGYAWNYTQPWYLTGLNVNYAINEMIDLGVYVVNSTANTDIDENENMGYGAAVNIRPMEAMKIRLNYLTAKEGGGALAGTTLPGTASANYYNAIVSYDWSSFQATVQYSVKNSDGDLLVTSSDSDVLGVYLGYKQDVWGLGFRYEMAKYDQLNGTSAIAFPAITVPGASDNNINAYTLTGWYDVDQNARLKLEVSQHTSDEDVFADDDGAAEDSLLTYGAGFAYRF